MENNLACRCLYYCLSLGLMERNLTRFFFFTIQLSALFSYFDFLQTPTKLFFNNTEYTETTVITRNEGNHMVLSCRCHCKWSSITLRNNKCSHTVYSHNPPTGAVASNGASFLPVVVFTLSGVVMCSPNLLRLTPVILVMLRTSFFRIWTN